MNYVYKFIKTCIFRLKEQFLDEYSSYCKALVKSGAVSTCGEPVYCLCCLSEKTNVINRYYIEYTLCEFDIICENCGSILPTMLMETIISNLRELHLRFGEYPISFLYQQYLKEEEFELCNYIFNYSKVYEINLEVKEDDFIKSWMSLGADYRTAKWMFDGSNPKIYIQTCDQIIRDYDKLAKDI